MQHLLSSNCLYVNTFIRMLQGLQFSREAQKNIIQKMNDVFLFLINARFAQRGRGGGSAIKFLSFMYFKSLPLFSWLRHGHCSNACVRHVREFRLVVAEQHGGRNSVGVCLKRWASFFRSGVRRNWSPYVVVVWFDENETMPAASLLGRGVTLAKIRSKKPEIPYAKESGLCAM